MFRFLRSLMLRAANFHWSSSVPCICTSAFLTLVLIFRMHHVLGPYFFDERKLQNYRTHAFLDIRSFAYILYFVPRFDTRGNRKL